MRARSLLSLVAALVVLAGIAAFTYERSPAPAGAITVETHSISATEFATVLWFHADSAAVASWKTVTTCLPASQCVGLTHASLAGSVVVDSFVRLKPAPNATFTGTWTLIANGAGTAAGLADTAFVPYAFTNHVPAPFIVVDSSASRD